MMRKVIVVVAAFLVGLSLNVHASPKYGELTLGLRQAPNVCIDIVAQHSFYAGVECDY